MRYGKTRIGEAYKLSVLARAALLTVLTEYEARDHAEARRQISRHLGKGNAPRLGGPAPLVVGRASLGRADVARLRSLHPTRASVAWPRRRGRRLIRPPDMA